MKTIWLRNETKTGEERCALTPIGARILIEKGYKLIVEESPNRIYNISEYQELGATIAPTNSWKDAPLDAIILGLKELEECDTPLKRTHIHFAHVYKNQNGSQEFLKRFKLGGGKLYDLEYLVDHKNKRVAAFGIWAGFAGSGLAIDAWALRQRGVDYNSIAPLSSYKNSRDFINVVKDNLSKASNSPKTLIIGANGRCGRGAQAFLKELGLSPTLWGSQETSQTDILKTAVDYDILINCAFIKSKATPFLTDALIDGQRKLSLISDVGCDPTGPCNPLPIYQDSTTLTKPVTTLRQSPRLEITAIDHLPSLLPKESSEDFESQFLPHFIDFLEEKSSGPFNRALHTFNEKIEERTDLQSRPREDFQFRQIH